VCKSGNNLGNGPQKVKLTERCPTGSNPGNLI